MSASQQPEPVSAPKPVSGVATRRVRRTKARVAAVNIHPSVDRPTPLKQSLTDAVIGYLWPWTSHNYPGVMRGVLSTLGNSVTWQSIHWWRHEKYILPLWAARTFADAVDADLRRGSDLSRRLHEHITMLENAPKRPLYGCFAKPPAA